MALMMGKSNELAIFRRFNDLNMLSLLSLQGEILDLRQEFHDICEDDESPEEGGDIEGVETGGQSLGGQTNDDYPSRHFAKSFQKLLQSKDSPNNWQYHKLMEIRRKMAEYSKTLERAEPPQRSSAHSLTCTLRFITYSRY